MTPEQTIAKMLHLQNELNCLTIGPDWIIDRLPWNLAISQEAAELIDHLGYKWWAKQKPNYLAAQVEVIDMMHFSLAYAIRSYPSLSLLSVAHQLNLHVANRVAIVRIDQSYFDPRDLTPVQLAGLITIEAGLGITCFGHIVYLGEQLGMSFDDQAQLYQSKVVLNTFRQKNGYKEGTYRKLWAPNKEDNDVMQEIARKEIDWKNPQAAEELYSSLERSYKTLLSAVATANRVEP